MRGIVFAGMLSTWVVAEAVTGWQPVQWLVGCMAVLSSVLVAWMAGVAAGTLRTKKELELHLGEQKFRTVESQRRLDSVIQLNRQLIEAEDEQSLINTALNVVSGLTGALASSFVPLDEVGEPLSAIVQGSLPTPILKVWAEHLASQLVRKTCGKCQELHADVGQVCPLLQGPFADAFSVYCLPLRRGERYLGLLNVYFGPHHLIDIETRTFLEGLLAEMGNALQVVRLRGQELATLRHLQMAHANRSDLAVTLGDLLENLRKSFEVDMAWLRTNASVDRKSALDIRRGNGDWPENEQVQACFAQIEQEGRVIDFALPDGWAVGAPLVLPDGQGIGAILLFAAENCSPLPQQLAVLQTMAAQAALLIESERERDTMEFAIVIQERTRLAREIHDGLAQTLAYLKLQTAQMQRALSQNEMDTLKELLGQNYAALAEAYLDARQAIDNLRLNPQQGMGYWLEQVALEFEHLSGIPVRRSFEPVSGQIPLEVQAQMVRIVQEIFSNIRKHAQAKEAWIVLKEWESDLILEVGDDGRGFQTEDLPEWSRYGLRGMRERAELIGADFQVASRPGQGTIVHLRLPARSWEVLQ
jgi:two-component system, NarL family, nitrate/nitrite sensor histidine kinase NarX